jgi:membrane fusion protein (multidrug efflux system)
MHDTRPRPQEDSVKRRARRGGVLRWLIGTVILLLVLAICGGLVWFNFFRDKMIGQFFAHFPVPTITISTIAVAPERWTPGIDAVGTVSASQGVDVSGQVAGVVKSILFKGNDKVAAGDVMVQIDDSLERADIDAAQSTVAVNQDALVRTQQLFQRNFATSADLQAAQNKLALAQGVLDRIKATLAQKAIKAPFGGVTGIPKVEVGQYLAAGTAIATLQDLTKMRVDFTVPEQQLPAVAIGQPVSVGLSEGRLDFKGTITGIDPKIDPQSRLVSLRAVVDNAKDVLRPGQFARVRVELKEEPSVIALPQTAVVISLYGSYVYQVVEAPPAASPPAAAGQPAAAPAPGAAPQAPPGPQYVAKQIFVETGRRSGTEIEITKGVEPGMQIVTSGQNKLSNGSHVAIDNSINPANATTADASK